MSDPFDDLGPLPEPQARFEEVASRLAECERWDQDLSLAALGETPPPAHLESCASCRDLFTERRRVVGLLDALPRPRARCPVPVPRRPGFRAAAAAAFFAAILVFAIRPGPVQTPPVSPASALPGPLTRFTLAFDRYFQSDDPRERPVVESEILSLGRIVIPHLVRAAGDPDERITSSALELLERIGLPDILPALEARLDGNPWRNESIFRTIVRLDASSPAILRGLFNPARQAQALAALDSMPPRRAVPVLLTAYPRLSPPLRERADKVLLSESALARQVLSGGWAALDSSSLAALAPLVGTLKLRQAAPELLKLARSPEHAPAALEGLARMGDPGLLQAVLALPGENAGVYLRARGNAAAGELRGLAVHPDPKVARRAVMLLGDFGGPETPKQLRSLLSQPAIRAEVLQALARMPGAEPQAILLEACSREESRDELVAVLGARKSPEVLPHLLKLAWDPRVSLATTVESLSSYPLEETVPPLISGLQGGGSRARAHELLKRLTGEKKISSQAGAWERWWKAQNSG